VLQIDGSHGEGGGQILRTAIGLSTITSTPIEIYNIRAHRTKPGLRPSHYTALSIMKEICNADTQGLTVESTKIS